MESLLFTELKYLRMRVRETFFEYFTLFEAILKSKLSCYPLVGYFQGTRCIVIRPQQSV